MVTDIIKNRPSRINLSTVVAIYALLRLTTQEVPRTFYGLNYGLRNTTAKIRRPKILFVFVSALNALACRNAKSSDVSQSGPGIYIDGILAESSERDRIHT